ncbi:MAG: FtsX-like permease family protein [Clostridia bacterium]|nr:FtsX-like permease family protein [Clostridia bacterium]
MKRLFVKIIRDLLKDKLRTFLSLLAIAIGMTAFGLVMFSYNILTRELSDIFTAINPVSASIMVDKIDDRLIDLTRGFKEIGEFEEKGYYELRLKLGENKWKTLHLYAVKDFSKMRINKVKSQEGSFSPGKNEVLIERDALGVANAVLNKNIKVALPDSSIRELKVVGVVHDIVVHPASIENIIPVYISYDSLEDLGLIGNRMDVILADNKYDRKSILAAGNDYIKLLETNGYKVSDIDISSTPGRSMHQSEYDSILFILQVFAIIAFLLGCMIMSSLLSSILSSQIRQIGVLKAIGAKTSNIFLSYMLIMLALVSLTSAVSVPASTALAKSFSVLMMRLGNMELGSSSIPVNLIVLFCVLSFVIPMIISIFPIRRGVKITVREAINDYGTVQHAGSSRQDMPGVDLRLFSRPVMLSIRNAARRKGRFYLNVISLTLSGAIFIAAITAMVSMSYTISKDLETFNFDYQIRTSNSVDDSKLDYVIKNIPEIIGYENWGHATGKLIYNDGKAGNLYDIMALSPNTKAFKPEQMEGRWLSDHDTNEIVVGHQFFSNEPAFRFGDTIAVKFGNKEQRFKIVGTIKELGSPTIYMTKKSYDKLVPAENKKNSIKLMIQPGISEKQNLYQKTEDRLREAGVIIFQSESMEELLEVLEAHGTLIIVFFLAISIMVVVVAGFGLSSTMNVQVTERTREIGIMKAMGASRRQIKRIVTAESVFISIVSWLVSIILGIPLGALVAFVVGNIMVSTSLDVNYAQSYIPVVIWLVLTLTISYAASRTASKRASKMSVKETLAFE